MTGFAAAAATGSQPQFVLSTLVHALLGIVGISAAISVLVAILRHYLSDDSESAAPSLLSFGRVGGFVLVMAALAGYAMKGSSPTAFAPWNGPTWSDNVDPTTGWLPQNVVTQQTQGTLGETITAIGLANRKQYDNNTQAAVASAKERITKVTDKLREGDIGGALWQELKNELTLNGPGFQILKIGTAIRNDVIDKAAEEKAAADAEAGKRELRITNDKASLKDYFDQFLYNHYKRKGDGI